jgi:hypothetical protein
MLAPCDESQGRRAGGTRISRAVFIYPRGTTPETQFSFSFSCSVAFLAGRSLARIWASMSRAVSG